MTLLKRLQEDAVAKFETQIRVQYINQTDLKNVITNTVTAVLAEVEREVEKMKGNESDGYYEQARGEVADIIQSKRTEI